MAHIQKKIKNDGSIAYVVRWRDPSGSERSKSFATEREAKAHRNRTETALTDTTYVDPRRQKITLRELVERDANRAETANTKSTKLACAKNLGPLGDMPIGKISSSDIERWLTTLRNGRPWEDGKPLASSSASIYLRAVKTALNGAVNAHPPLLAKSPAKNVRLPKGADRQAVTADEIMTTKEAEALIAAAKHITTRGGNVTASNSPLWVMILLHISTGLRPGELCGLYRRDIDLKAGELRVRQQSGRKARPWAAEPLKTPASRREVPIPTRALTALTEHLEATALEGRRLADGNQADDYPVFMTRRGGQYTSTTYGEIFASAVERAKLEHDYTPHDCRHFYASMLIAHGVDLATVQALLGHSNPSETLRTYTHLWPDNWDRTRRVVDEVLSEPVPSDPA